MPEHIDPSFCIRCGACKAPCPTFDLDFDETMTARGRLRLLLALEEGRLEPTPALRRRISTCLLCGSCQPRCPAGVDIMEIIYRGRERLFGRSRWARFLGARFTAPARADALVRWGSVLHKPFTRALEKTGRFRYIPPFPKAPFRLENQVFKPKKKPRGRVAFFVGCAINYLYPEIGDDLVALLIHCGYEVVAIRGEVCCGAPHRELGQTAIARTLVEKNLEIFGRIQAEAVITACPTCALTLREQYPRIVPEASALAERVEDVNRFLASRLDGRLGSAGLGDVVYHDPCHLMYGLSVRSEPRELLAASGARVLELRGETSCCGFGGTFGISHYDLSKRIGQQRRHAMEKTGARHLVTACPGCMLQFQDAFKGEDVKVWHTVEILRRAIEGE